MTDFWRRTRLAASLFRRWLLVLRGKSYWHVLQGLGKRFVPGELAGYFNDLTLKVGWNGPVDEQGLPIHEYRGKQLYFATKSPWSLGLLACYCRRKTPRGISQDCAMGFEKPDEAGGWPLWSLLDLPYLSPYSAMTQGQGISLLVRAYVLTQERAFLQAAQKALEPLKRPIDEGGTCRVVPEGVVLEEVPYSGYRAILNGWIFALFGLYDYLLVEDNNEVSYLMGKSLDALEAYLPYYRAGYWSLYDLSGHLASPFYHRLHIAQLQALSLAFPDRANTFHRLEAEFSRQLRSPIGRLRALTAKAIQKLRQPPEVVLE